MNYFIKVRKQGREESPQTPVVMAKLALRLNQPHPALNITIKTALCPPGPLGHSALTVVVTEWLLRQGE